MVVDESLAYVFGFGFSITAQGLWQVCTCTIDQICDMTPYMTSFMWKTGYFFLKKITEAV